MPKAGTVSSGLGAQRSAAARLRRHHSSVADVDRRTRLRHPNAIRFEQPHCEDSPATVQV
jgi:hypothetical protein